MLKKTKVYRNPAAVKVNYLLRDEDQSLIAGRERIERKVAKAKLANEAGFSNVEIWGGTQVEVPARFKGEHPYKEGLTPLSKATPDVGRMMLFRSQSANGRAIYSDQVVSLAMDVMTRNERITVIRAFDANNNLHKMQTVFEQKKKLQSEGRPFTLQMAMAYSQSERQAGDPEEWRYRDVDFYVDLADHFVEHGADEICIKDMAGLIEPNDAYDLIQRVKINYPNMPVTLHMHASGGQAQQALLMAIKAGVDGVDVSVEGMSDWVGHVSAQDLLWLMENSDDPDITDRIPVLDHQKLDEIKQQNLETRLLNSHFELPYDPEIQDAVIEAGLPGGMATTFINSLKDLYDMDTNAKRQALKSKGGDPSTIQSVSRDELKRATIAALKKVPEVTRDLGYLEKVTPTSDITAKQAAYNWYYGEKGAADYQVFGPGFAEYVLGYQGQSQNAPRKEILEMVEKRLQKERLRDMPFLKPSNIEISAAKERLVKNGVHNPDDEDILTAILSGSDGIGFSFIRSYYDSARETGVEYYTPENPPIFPSFASSPRPEVFGPKEEMDAVGLLFLEEMIQMAQKIQMIHDGAAFSGVDARLKKAYIGQKIQKVNEMLQEVEGKLSKAGFSKMQILARVFSPAAGLKDTIQAYIQKRSAELGVRSDFLPIISERPQFKPNIDYGDAVNEKNAGLEEKPAVVAG